MKMFNRYIWTVSSLTSISREDQLQIFPSTCTEKCIFLWYIEFSISPRLLLDKNKIYLFLRPKVDQVSVHPLPLLPQNAHLCIRLIYDVQNTTYCMLSYLVKIQQLPEAFPPGSPPMLCIRQDSLDPPPPNLWNLFLDPLLQQQLNYQYIYMYHICAKWSWPENTQCDWHLPIH